MALDALLFLATAFVVGALLYIYTVSVVQTRFPTLRNKRVCLLIAHPDDEAMFFAPTVLALTRPDTGNHVKILCLSTGNADGLGETRRRELVKSALLLGLRAEEDVFTIDAPEFPDSMAATWDASKISTLLCEAFAPHLSKKAKPRGTDPGGAPSANIDVLITFDAQGVSSHPNHISLYHGARAFLSSLMAGKSGWRPPVDLYTLRTVSLGRKYTGFADILATLTSWAFSVRFKDKKHPGGLLFANQLVGERGLWTAWAAMTQAHKSQMVWFRWGWILFSRYMVMNDLRLEKAR